MLIVTLYFFHDFDLLFNKNLTTRKFEMTCKGAY